MLNTVFDELADRGYLELSGNNNQIIDTRALRNALQGKFLGANIAYANFK